MALHYALVTCEIKLFQHYFSLPRRLCKIILFQRVETCLKSVADPGGRGGHDPPRWRPEQNFLAVY